MNSEKKLAFSEGDHEKILILERFSLNALSFLNSHPNIEALSIQQALTAKTSTAEQTDQLEQLFKNCTGLIIRSQTKVHEKFLKSFSNLKVIVTATSGFDHIDFSAIQPREIKAMYCPEGNAQSAAEMTWALLLSCCRKIHLANNSVSNNEWDRQKLMGCELSDKTIGIIGLGRVGRRVANFAKAFGMHVQYHDPYLDHSKQTGNDEVSGNQPNDYENLSLIELLRSSDVITLHAPLTRKTKHLLNHRTFENFLRQPILINAARGGLIHEEALVEALQSQTVTAAGLDVFEKEPLPQSSSLRQFKQVVLSPHLGGTTEQAFEKVSMEAAEKIIHFFKQGDTPDLLPDSISWKDDL